MKRLKWLVLILILGFAKVLPVYKIPDILVGEPSFFPTIEAYTDAPIVGGNRIDLLFNGDETFPAMLCDIKTAKSTTTFAQYLYEDGAISYEFAQAFSDRCRAGVQVYILIDNQGSQKIPGEIPTMMRDAGCHVEFFRRVEAQPRSAPRRSVQARSQIFEANNLRGMERAGNRRTDLRDLCFSR